MVGAASRGPWLAALPKLSCATLPVRSSSSAPAGDWRREPEQTAGLPSQRLTPPRPRGEESKRDRCYSSLWQQQAVAASSSAASSESPTGLDGLLIGCFPRDGHHRRC